MEQRICSIDGCGARAKARGWCGKHYQAWTKHGDPEFQREHPIYRDPAKAIAARTERRGDCLIWTGRIGVDGYGYMKTGGKVRHAHRIAWELERGPIPEGMQVDHTCWNPACVAVEHLRLATPHENLRSLQGPKSTNRSTGYRNIRPNGSGYEVCITKNGVKHSKTLRTLNDAIDYANAKRAELFGEFAGAQAHYPKETP